MKIKYISFLLVTALVFNACDSDIDNLADPVIQEVSENTQMPNYTSGTADFSTYVAVGNSLTAGFSDGALFIEGQKNSISSLLAKQFQLAGGGSFSIPMMNDNVGGLLFGGAENPSFGPRLIFDLGTQTPMPVSGTPSTDVFDVQPGPYNNMGVPGAKAAHLLYNGFGNPANLGVSANPYYVRMASASDATVLGDALAMNPTFYTLWIGNNDVLGYAINGGDANEDQITPLTGGLGVGFTETYNYILGALASSGANGIVANIPNVTDTPYFTTVPYNPVPLDAATAAALNSGYTTYNGGVQFAMANSLISADEAAERTISFSEGSNNALVIIDEYLTDLTAYGIPSYRQATADDLLILTLSQLIPQGYGTQIQLEDKFVLTPEEQQEIADATMNFNQVIADAAAAMNVPLFDVNAFFGEVASTGYQAGSAFMTADYVTGGTFSLDGIHPSPRGNAVVVNQMISVINENYQSNLPTLNPVDYTGLYID